MKTSLSLLACSLAPVNAGALVAATPAGPSAWAKAVIAQSAETVRVRRNMM